MALDAAAQDEQVWRASPAAPSLHGGCRAGAICVEGAARVADEEEPTLLLGPAHAGDLQLRLGLGVPLAPVAPRATGPLGGRPAGAAFGGGGGSWLWGLAS